MYSEQERQEHRAQRDRRQRLTALAALAEPLRRSLYLHVVSSLEPVSRESAAEALGLTRSVAAFHLDKLAEVGVLEVEYRRPPGRSGPGAGRPAKFYRRATQDLDFSVPERRYDLAAAILAQAVSDATTQSIPVDGALRQAAREYGRVIGAGFGAGGSDGEPGASGDDDFARVLAVLAAHGYEPTRDGESITLGNCPFHALAEEHRALVCGMNLEVIAGVLEGAAAAHMAARLDPAPGRCCVTVLSGAAADTG
ncbi:MAG TPA: helix-turn-helix domain-containing protein [Acidimicrobiales bacterium]